jgi:tryptophan 2,3-dioxygenase
MAENDKYTTIHYHNYLELDRILNSQHPRSAVFEKKAAHEEMLFIIIHQVYELWFKQIIHELQSIAELFRAESIDEKNLGTVIGRLNRVEEIFKLLIQQIEVLETMTPLDFLDFRNYLFPASGFQSMQFRVTEILMGLPEGQRITYNGKQYNIVFTDEQKAFLADVQHQGSLFELIEIWLERTPFLHFGSFDFLSQYSSAVERMIEKERKAIQASEYLTEESKLLRMQMLGNTDTYFQNVLNPKVHEENRKKGLLRMSYKATLAALLIHLYREQPILHMPFMLLQSVKNIDELMTTWRYRHAQMVLRMIGNKIGTGGSSGHSYLAETADKHKIFMDLHNISSLLIPRSELPSLPEDLTRELGFFYGSKS